MMVRPPAFRRPRPDRLTLLIAAIALLGAGLALATMAAGRLYALSPGAAFHAMAGLCACGGAGALSLARAERRAAAQPPASRFTKRRPQ